MDADLTQTNPAVEVLTALRGSIDNLDAAIVHLLAERFKCTQKVGALKAAHGMPPSDPARGPGRSSGCIGWPWRPNSIRCSPSGS